MTLPAPTYDLVLLLDPRAEDGARAKIVADTRASIEGGGELLRHDEWGERALSYPIEKQANAEYHLLQFHASGPELLEGLERTLRITDGVVRFRIVKLRAGVPEAPEMAAAPAVRQPEAPSAPAPEAEPAAPAEAVTEPESASPAEAPPAEAPVAETV